MSLQQRILFFFLFNEFLAFYLRSVWLLRAKSRTSKTFNDRQLKWSNDFVILCLLLVGRFPYDICQKKESWKSFLFELKKRLKEWKNLRPHCVNSFIYVMCVWMSLWCVAHDTRMLVRSTCTAGWPIKTWNVNWKWTHK